MKKGGEMNKMKTKKYSHSGSENNTSNNLRFDGSTRWIKHLEHLSNSHGTIKMILMPKLSTERTMPEISSKRTNGLHQPQYMTGT